MPLGEFFSALSRRWLLVLIGFLLTAGLSGAAYMVFKPTYEATGTVLLLPPPSTAPTGSVNPYLQLGGLSQAVDLIGVALSDQATQLELQKISKDVEFTVKADARTSSPLLVIDVKDSSPEVALQIRDILVARVPVRLDEMQKALSLNTKDRITSTVVTLDAEAVEVGRNRLRAAVVVGVVGLGLTFAAAALWDARRLRHPRRRIVKRDGTDPDSTTSREPIVEAVHSSSLVDDPGAAGDPVDAGAADLSGVAEDVFVVGHTEAVEVLGPQHHDVSGIGDAGDPLASDDDDVTVSQSEETTLQELEDAVSPDTGSSEIREALGDLADAPDDARL